jgi:phenylalanine-4-hydroxylase
LRSRRPQQRQVSKCLKESLHSLYSDGTFEQPYRKVYITNISFSVQDEVGALDKVLSNLAALSVNLKKIESRPSKTRGNYDFYVDFEAKNKDTVTSVVSSINPIVKSVTVIRMEESDVNSSGFTSVPWFPRHIADLDSFSDKVLSYGSELDADHPGFKDLKYRERRNEITNLAKTYEHGMKLPHIDYTSDEIKTWYDSLH